MPTPLNEPTKMEALRTYIRRALLKVSQWRENGEPLFERFKSKTKISERLRSMSESFKEKTEPARTRLRTMSESLRAKTEPMGSRFRSRSTQGKSAPLAINGGVKVFPDAPPLPRQPSNLVQFHRSASVALERTGSRFSMAPKRAAVSEHAPTVANKRAQGWLDQIGHYDIA